MIKFVWLFYFFHDSVVQGPSGEQRLNKVFVKKCLRNAFEMES